MKTPEELAALFAKYAHCEKEGEMGDVVKINGEYVTDAIGFVYDGCHKIYLVFNDDDVKKAKQYEYNKVFPMSELFKTFRDSCPLRFIQTFGDYRDVVSQCAKEAVFEFADGEIRKIKC